MMVAFYTASAVAILATLGVITAAHAVHALLYLIVSLLAVAMIFLLFGAPLAAAFEIVIYAGAIMVLFLFAVMMLSPGPQSADRERGWLRSAFRAGPLLLSVVLVIELAAVVASGPLQRPGAAELGPHAVAEALFGSYLPAIEMASMLLLAGLVGAVHLARHAGRRAGTGPGKETGP